MKTPELLADFGKGLIEAMEEVEIAVERGEVEYNFERKTEKAAPNILDLSNAPIEDLAKSLSDLMHNPNLPPKMRDCLADELSEVHTNIHTPENVLENLKSQLENKGE